MDTLKIKALLCAVQNKSLSKAAEEFSYTPSAFSHMADSIEAELGVRLLKRSSAGVELTKEGELLYEKLTAVVNAEKELFRTANELSESKGLQLRIGTYSSISQRLLPEILKSFKKAYPNFKISIHVGDKLRDWLEEDVADIIFADVGSFGKNEWVPIMSDPFLAVVPSNTFVGRKSVQREELYDFAYVSTNESSLRTYFDENRFKELVHFDSVDDTSVISMVREGVGIAVLPSLMLQKQIKGVRLLKLEPPFTRTLGFAYKKSAVSSRSTATFIRYLKDELGYMKNAPQ